MKEFILVPAAEMPNIMKCENKLPEEKMKKQIYENSTLAPEISSQLIEKLDRIFKQNDKKNFYRSPSYRTRLP